MLSIDELETYHRKAMAARRHGLANEIARQRMYQQGVSDREAGKPCKINSGAYLNGYHDTDADGSLYYVTRQQLRGLDD